MIERFDLETEYLEDALRAEVDLRLRDFQRSGAIGDLIRLRDARVKAGVRLRGVTTPSFVRNPTPLRRPTKPAKTSDLPEIDIKDMTPEVVKDLLSAHGALLLRNAMVGRQTLRFLQMFEDARAAASEFHVLESAGRDDNRSTNSKEMYCKVKLPDDLTQDAVDTFSAGGEVVPTFMSPRISFEWLNFLTEVGLKRVVQQCFQDDARFAFDSCVFRRWRQTQAQPSWPDRDPRKSSLRLWMPLHDCGAHTDQLTPTVGQAPWTPFVVAGDIIIMEEGVEFSIGCNANIAQKLVSIETTFIPRSQANSVEHPVFW